MPPMAFAILSCCLLGGSIAGLAAAEPPAPGRPAAETTIDKADLEKAIATQTVVLLDVNGTKQFTRGHIPSAIDFFAHQTELASLLPVDKNALIVAYCGSSQCPSYKKGMLAAIELGYTNVRHFAPGLKGWVDSGGKLEPAKREKREKQDKQDKQDKQ